MKRNVLIRFVVSSLFILLVVILIIGLFRPVYVRNLFVGEQTSDYTVQDINSEQDVADNDAVETSSSSQGVSLQSLTIAGQKRTYAVYVPPGAISTKTSADVLIVFHGTGGSGEGIREVGFDAYAESSNFITVYPDSLSRDGVAKWDPANRQIKDIDFVKAVIADLEDSVGGEIGNVYVAGMSNGSVMAQAVGCLVPGIYGVAGVSAGIGSEMIPYCNLPQPIPFIGFYGTLDRFGEIEKYELSVAHFAKENGCTDSYQASALPDVDTEDGTTVERRVYQAAGGQACETPVHYYRIEGGGHFWPGAERYRADRLERNSGFISKDIDATKLIVDFFGLTN